MRIIKRSIAVNKKKKNNIDHNQMSFLEEKSITEKLAVSESKLDVQKKNINKTVPKGELLEYRIKRLLFFMGYFPKTNIIVQTSPDEPNDIVTDLDVYGIYLHSDFSIKTIWADCKSGAAQEINRIAWLNGIKEHIKVDDILFVKGGTKLSTKIYASRKNIQIVDLSTIAEMQKRFGVEEEDWRIPWNPVIQSQNLKIFKSITTPNNITYKKIAKFIHTHYWAQEDNYTRCKQTITALRDLAVVVELPLKEEQKISIKWAIYQLCGMLTLAMLQICRQIQYFPDKDKEELINLGLLYGKNSKAKIEDILKITNNIAKKTLCNYCVDAKLVADLPEIKLHQPDYTEAFLNMVFRIISQPLSYQDILRFMEFALFQYDLNKEKYCVEELGEIFINPNELIKSEKTLLHFICHVTGISKDIFILLSEE